MKKVLLIEDDLDLYQLLKYNLERSGFQFTGANTGKGAVELCLNERPDLILLDIMLPDSSGLEICARLRNQTMMAGTPIIFLTARASESDRVMGLELGANDYIVKPFSIRELIARVKVQLRPAAEIGTTVLRFGKLELDRSRYQAFYNGDPIVLTATEFRLLEFLMSRPGIVFDREQLLSAFGGATGRLLAVPWMFIYYDCAKSSKLLPTISSSSTRFVDSDTASIPRTSRRPMTMLSVHVDLTRAHRVLLTDEGRCKFGVGLISFV